MARGRKKNLTLPPSRSLDHQRAFRARKAQYVADLEERCHNAEAENEILRQQVASLKAALPTSIVVPSVDPELVSLIPIENWKRAETTTVQLRASIDLMHTLASTSTSLARFQELAQQNPPTGIFPSTTPVPNRHTLSTDATFQRPPSFLHTSTASTSASEVDLDTVSNSSDDLYGPNCCGGMMDCRGLIEEDHQIPLPRTEDLHSRDCCAGLVDCSDLIPDGHPISQARTSGL
jgi:hypothetical protein